MLLSRFKCFVNNDMFILFIMCCSDVLTTSDLSVIIIIIRHRPNSKSHSTHVTKKLQVQGDAIPSKSEVFVTCGPEQDRKTHRGRDSIIW